MQSINPSEIQFFECDSCKILHLIRKTDPIGKYVCSNCNSKKFRELPMKFLIHCPKCFEIWSRNMVKTSRKEGICECLNESNCDGLLKIRREWDEISALFKPNEKSKSDIESDVESEAKSLNPELLAPEVNLTFEPFPSANSASRKDISPSEESKVEKKTQNSVHLSAMHFEPHPILLIFSSIDPKLDLSTVQTKITDNEVDQLLLSFKICYVEELPLNSEDYINIFAKALLKMDSKKSLYKEESVNSVYYIGDLHGDFYTLQKIINYIIPIIEMYPTVKMVFLGNYFNGNPTGGEIFVALMLLYLKYPENIVLLRGAEDFHDRMNSFIINQTQQSLTGQKLTTIYRYILNIVSRLPICYTATMNQGKIRIFSSNSGILHHLENNDSLLLQHQIQNIKFGDIYRFEALSLMEKHLLQSKPETSKLVDLNFMYDQENFSNFIRDNQFHYMVRSNDFIPEGFKFDFEYSLCCTLTSTSKYHNKDLNEDITMKSKILRLNPGQSPVILDINDDLEKDLRETFGISIEML